jgi:hypothetical protein
MFAMSPGRLGVCLLLLAIKTGTVDSATSCFDTTQIHLHAYVFVGNGVFGTLRLKNLLI